MKWLSLIALSYTTWLLWSADANAWLANTAFRAQKAMEAKEARLRQKATQESAENPSESQQNDGSNYYTFTRENFSIILPKDFSAYEYAIDSYTFQSSDGQVICELGVRKMRGAVHAINYLASIPDSTLQSQVSKIETKPPSGYKVFRQEWKSIKQKDNGSVFIHGNIISQTTEDKKPVVLPMYAGIKGNNSTKSTCTCFAFNPDTFTHRKRELRITINSVTLVSE